MSEPLLPSLKKKVVESNSNPMVLPKVLQCLLGYMETKELLNFRSVNKQWNEQCSQLLQEKVIIVLRTWNGVNNFVSMFNSSKKRIKPFKTMKLDSSLQLRDGDLQEALGKNGLHFTSLIIGCHCNSEEWTLLLHKLFTNLEHLKITGSIPYEVDLKKMKPLSFLRSVIFHVTNKRSDQLFIRKFSTDLFSITPNLSSVTWSTSEVFTDLLPRAMFHCLIEAPKVTGITELCCNSLVFGIWDLKELADKRFPLRRLEISVGSEVFSNILGEFLGVHGETLKILYLNFGPANFNTIGISEDGKLKNLHTLTLEYHKRSVGFIIHAKKLRKLVLINSDMERAFSIDWDEDQLKHLPKLDVVEVYSEPWRKVQNFPLVAIVRLAHYFPKLKVLRLQNLDDKCLRRIFRNFPYLTELQAPCGIYTDDAFKVFGLAANFISDGCARSSSSYLQYSYSPANLTSLRRLEIDSICMSDEFILQGIIKWRGLRHLALKNCRIEESTLTRILMEMELHHLQLDCCEIVSQLEFEIYNPPGPKEPLEMGKELIEMNYGMIKKWRRAILQLLTD